MTRPATPAGNRSQLPGYRLWIDRLDDGWHVVDEQSQSLSGPHSSQESAAWNARRLVDTTGT